MRQAEERERAGWTRREVLAAGAAGVAGALPLARAEAAVRGPRAQSCIFILCTGGPSQLDTWDPKPDAPAEIRGPYAAIPTNVAGIRLSETLPLLARRADRFTLIRSMQSAGPALHEAALQRLQTGDFTLGGSPRPHLGSLVSRTLGPRGGLPAHVLLPRPLEHLGLHLDPGAGSSHLHARHAAVHPEAPGAAALHRSLSLRDEERARERYGDTSFGASLLRARRLVERGARWITVNQFDGIFHRHTWDCHGYPDLPTRVADLEREVAAPFDRAVSALLDDLQACGLLEETLVVCAGEFGRTPRINATGGRDHHQGCWSVMLAGGGVRSGQVVGASDGYGAEPLERPVTPAMLAATVLDALGVDHPLADGVREVWG